MGCSSSRILAEKNKLASSVRGRKAVAFDTCNFQETDAGLSEEDKKIVKRHWRVLSSDIQNLGTQVFLQIFKEHPEVKQLFPCRDVDDDKLSTSAEFRGHAYRFMQAVGAVVDNIDDLDQTMSGALIFLGKQHVTFSGIKPVHFDDFYYAITKVWKDVLGKRYTKERAKAWEHVFSYILEKLKKGFNSGY